MSAVEGSCLCGAIRFELSPPTAFCIHCHCSMCRRNHGAGYVTWVGLPKSQLRITLGHTDLVSYASSAHGERRFCGKCGSSLFCENDSHPDQIDVVLANLHGDIDREPQAHAYFSDRAAWVKIADDLPRLGGESGFEPLGLETDRGSREKAMSEKTTIVPKGMESSYDRLHFAPAVRHGKRLFCSGQIGTDDEGKLCEEPEAQIICAFENLQRVLSAGGASFEDLLDLTTFHVGFNEHIATFMKVKDQFIRAPYPAWTAIGVRELGFGALVEIKAVAAVPD